MIRHISASEPGKLSVTIAHEGESFELKTQHTGSHNSLPVAAAFACSHQLGAPAALIIKRMASFQPLFGRCSAHFISSGPIFIADTTKAAFHSIYLPINMMTEFNVPRRRIVIGQISDYAGNPNPKYRANVYRAARLKVAYQKRFVGENSHRSRATAEDIAARRFVEKRSVDEAAQFVKDTAMPGEIILLKSAALLHLEKG